MHECDMWVDGKIGQTDVMRQLLTEHNKQEILQLSFLLLEISGVASD